MYVTNKRERRGLERGDLRDAEQKERAKFCNYISIKIYFIKPIRLN